MTTESNLPEPVREALQMLSILQWDMHGNDHDAETVSDHIAALTQRAEQAEANAEAHARDAARLAFVKSHTHIGVDRSGAWFRWVNRVTNITGAWVESWDAAIDAAMQEPQP